MITQNNSLNDTGTNSIHMGKNKIILLPQTISDIQNLKKQLSFAGRTFIIGHLAVISTVFFSSIYYSHVLSLSLILFGLLNQPSRWHFTLPEWL